MVRVDQSQDLPMKNLQLQKLQQEKLEMLNHIRIPLSIPQSSTRSKQSDEQVCAEDKGRFIWPSFPIFSGSVCLQRASATCPSEMT
jgi:hypothetical protein